MTTTTLNSSAAQTVTITLTSLGDGAWRQSAVVDNDVTNKFLDALVGGSIQVGAVTADGTIDVYAYGSYDDTNFSGGVGSTDQAITWGTTGSTSVEGFRQLMLLGQIVVDTTDDNNDILFGPFSVAEVFGGLLPTKWGIVIENNTGVALNATGTNNEVQFTGLKLDNA